MYYMYGNSFVPGDLSVVENLPLLGVFVSGDSTADVQILEYNVLGLPEGVARRRKVFSLSNI